MRKRKLEEMDENQTNMDEPAKKKAKINDDDNEIKESAWNRSRLSKNNDNLQDEKQYNMIYKAIDTSGLIKKMEIPQDVVQQISDFGIGNLLKCWNKTKCKEKVSFLQNEKFEGLDKGIKCDSCGFEQYSTVCTFCCEECTSPDDVGMHCDKCKMAGCCDCIFRCCDECDTWWCKPCSDLLQK